MLIAVIGFTIVEQMFDRYKLFLYYRDFRINGRIYRLINIPYSCRILKLLIIIYVYHDNLTYGNYSLQRSRIPFSRTPLQELK